MKARVASEPLAELMDRHTVEGDPALAWAEGDRVRCVACGHRCLIGEGLRGICKARYNDRGTLRVPYGYVAGIQCDPVEKKPFFHVYPGSDALTFGMLGCDLHCSYCQNWLTSQALRDPSAVASLRPVTASELITIGRREGARLVVSSYNEPLITAEWSAAVFREARIAGLACAFVSNGNATPEVLDYLAPLLTAYKIDLKSFNDQRYRTLGGTLEAVLRSLEMVKARGLWLEVVTLLIPGFNDSEQELRDAARFLASLDRDIPWHVTAFHKDYHMTDPDPTGPSTLLRACEYAAEAGLRYVYAGNLPGQVGRWENTYCPGCQKPVIERSGYLVRSYNLDPNGACCSCGTRLAGVWPASASDVITGNDAQAYRSRLPRRVDGPQGQPLPVLHAPSTPSRGPKTMSPVEQVSLPSPVTERPSLTPEQRTAILNGTAAMLRGLVGGASATFPEGPEGLAQKPLSGAFVSLKRNGHLRACCGLLGTRAPLGRALEHASTRTVWDDARFPPISPGELEYLTLEVWILYNTQPLKVRGEERAQAVTVGKHGVQVVRGDSHGLFLPSVATENHWDSRKFLDQVCLKAGLAATAWRDDETVVSVFEGEALEGKAIPEGGARPSPRPRICTPSDLPRFVDFCRGNLSALLTGATPSYYFFGAPDGNLTGVVLTVQRPDTTELHHFMQVSLRPGVPLQTTLFGLTQGVAQYFVEQGMPLGTMGNLPMGVTLLHDPILHGSVAEHDLQGFDPRGRAILVMERNKSGLIYDPESTPKKILEDAVRRAHSTNPQGAAVYSLDVISTVSPVKVANVPKAVRGPANRPPAVAGTFYDANPETLKKSLDTLLGEERGQESWPAAMVPHAGWKYSGKIAADVLKKIRIPKHVIVLGPKHTPLGVDWAVAPHQVWDFPGGAVESDFLLARQLSQAISGLEMDAAAHQREHAIEVELPLIARLNPQARVLGIAIGAGTLANCKRFAEGLASVIRERPEPPLLLISSDMNHFANDADTRRLDAMALEAMEKLDPDLLYNRCIDQNISMCGVLPAVIVMETLRILGGLKKMVKVGYATSADVTGDTNRVVGYAGALLA